MRYCHLLVLCCLSLISISTTSAQDMKIRTHLFHVTPSKTGELQAQESAVSLTIFHAGRAYDYIDSVKEVIIFEPMQNRFTILNSARSLKTRVDFDELRQMLKVARHETEQYLEQIAEKNGGELPVSAHSLHAQLKPNFEESFHSSNRELTLQNSSIRYSVLCEHAEDESVHEAYLLYADWMARLNFVLHPQTMYPEARLSLNETLRKRKLYPTQVRLFLENDSKSHMKAQHRISRSLDSTDRMMIHEWASQLQKGNLKEVTFREYQEAIVLTHR